MFTHLAQVILCAVCGAGKLGMAYYHVDMALLFVMPDVAESEDFGMLRRGKLTWNCCGIYQPINHFFAKVLMQVEPSVIITSSKADSKMQKVINEYGMPSIAGVLDYY